MKKKCPNCDKVLRKVFVSVEDAKQKMISFQCRRCEYFEFDPVTSQRVVDELREQNLKIKQKIVKLSGERLGMYFNKHVVESLGLKKGEEISISVPDKKHILIELG